MEIRRSLELGEYDDPAEVRRMLRGRNCTPDYFRDALWSAILAAFPCPKKSGIPGNLTAAKQKLWAQLCADEPELTDHERIFKKCQNSNLCMQCECKKRIIDFFEQIGSGSTDTIRHRLASWLSGRVSRLDRVTYIQLCFAMNMRVHPSDMQLSDEQKLNDVNRFLTLSCKQPPLYTIKADEAVYYYCLANPGDRTNAENWLYACRLIERSSRLDADGKEDMFTMHASSMIESVRSEADLFGFISRCCLDDRELYYTAKENCRLLFEQFDIAEQVAQSVDESRRLTGKLKKSRNILKKDALRILNTLSEYDELGKIDDDVVELIEKHEFGDILYSSDQLEGFLDGDVMPDRTILLLTVLAQNCGMRYDPSTNTLEESDDLTDLPSFSEYFGNLATLLRNMCMAPLYPRRRMDFIVLYAYHILQKDFMAESEIGSLSEYIVRALKITMEGNKNA